MTASWMRARAELRGRWRAWVLLGVLLGVAGAVTITAAIGAGRTSTVFDRLVTATAAHDVIVQENDEPREGLLEAIGSLPMVAAAGTSAMFPADTAEAPGAPFSWSVSAIAPADARSGATIDIPRLIAGRRPHQDDPAEAMASPAFLRTRNVRIGDTFTMRLGTFEELFALFGGAPIPPTAPVVTVRIVGVGQLPDDVGLTEQNQGLLHLTRAFHTTYREGAASLDLLMVRLRHGARDLAAFTAQAQQLAGAPQALGITTRADTEALARDALRTQSGALWGSALVLALAAALLIGQAIARAVWLASRDDAHVVALGMSRGGLIAGAMIPVALTASVGTVVAVAGAIIGSWGVPVGWARTLDPDVGILVEAAPLALGGAAVFAIACARGLATAVWLTRTTTASTSTVARRPSTFPTVLARRGAGPEMVAGARFAFEPGSGRFAVPVRSVIAGIVIAVIAITAATTFEASFRTLTNDPRAYGWAWDAVLAGGEEPEVAERISASLDRSPLVTAHATTSNAALTLRGKDLLTMAVSPAGSEIQPRVVRGRAPRSDREVALGRLTMRELGLEIGDEISLPGSAASCSGTDGCPLPYRVTGVILFWSESGRPGTGAVLTPAGQDRLATSNGFIDVLVRLAPGATTKALVASLGRTTDDIMTPHPPADVQNLGRTRGVNAALTVILAALAFATVILALVTSVARRSRDVAILKTLGFVRAQVRRTIAWQAAFLMAAALAVGVPLGIAIGRWLWTVLAEGLGVAAEPRVPVGFLTLGALAAIAAASVIALGPARHAARTAPASTLRAP